jgi:hypothetical protein
MVAQGARQAQARYRTCPIAPNATDAGSSGRTTGPACSEAIAATTQRADTVPKSPESMKDVGPTPVLLNTCTGMVMPRSTAYGDCSIDGTDRPHPPNLKPSSSYFGDDDRDIVAAPVSKGALDQGVNDGGNVAFYRHGVRDLLVGKLVE